MTSPHSAPRLDLPTYYYVEHFEEMLGFVARVYGGMLSVEHEAFIAAFETLPRRAQCLYVRMANRRRTIFPLAALAYAEIGPAGPAAAQLVAAGFARFAGADDWRDVLALQTKPALLDLAERYGIAVKGSWAKARLGETLADALPPHALPTDGYLVRTRVAALDFILFLYFGRCETDLKSFALRDLGIVAVHERQDFSARFEHSDEASSCFTDSRWRLRLAADPDAAIDAAVYLNDAAPAPTDYARSLRAAVAFAAGQQFERQKDSSAALAVYARGDSPECRERRVRLLHTAGDAAAAKLLLEAMLDDPATDAEHDFATDFHARKFGGRRAGACTDLLRAAQTIAIDEAHRQAPEEGAAAHFRRLGYDKEHAVHHVENGLWHTVFGLLFWDELYGDHAALGSGFDAVPPALKDGRFARLHANRIAAKLAAVEARRALPILLRTIATAWGTPNGMIAWDYVDIDVLRDFLAAAPPVALSTMLRLMTEDFRNCRDGFPDLLVIEKDNVRFVEVKATGDTVRRNQLARLRQLQRAGFDAGICRVEYSFDPGQTYVVVDIETTGGSGSGDRVTEIGAVKIRGHEIVDEWQSLLNPQRRIPGHITRLTGISDDMVRDAPLFSEIADHFAAFMADGVFVAHNVNFDYGFINHEFARLGRRFRYPKFCTVAEMRRHFPGHASYSLANLCDVYGIDLTGHHRALNDARAAAGLLERINRKRAAA